MICQLQAKLSHMICQLQAKLSHMICQLQVITHDLSTTSYHT
jgi:hypothetical protein